MISEREMGIPEVSKQNRSTVKKTAELMQASTGYRFSISKPETTIGKLRQSDIQLENTAVSRKHAIIYNVLDRFLIEDLESVNKTWVNGIELIPHRLAELKTGDTLIIANEEFIFSVIH